MKKALMILACLTALIMVGCVTKTALPTPTTAQQTTITKQFFFIRGEVVKQGKYELSEGMTLLRAITKAGGYTEMANVHRVKVFRGDEVSLLYAEHIADGKEEDPKIQHGDIIEVERRHT